jgi:hypothetical protein
MSRVQIALPAFEKPSRLFAGGFLKSLHFAMM